MVEGCTLAEWTTNSQVVLASAKDPQGPFEKIKTIVVPWAHNPQTIRAPDNGTSKQIYAVYTLGDGYNYTGPPKNCGGTPVPPPPPPPPKPAWSSSPCQESTHHGDGWSHCMVNGTANFSIFWSDTPNGTYHRHTAQILDWPTHRVGRPWDYGSYGNSNPAPIVHPNGSVYILVHPEQCVLLLKIMHGGFTLTK